MARTSFSRALPEERRRELIAATLDLIGEGGLEAATVRNIAVRAGVTQGLIRHHFSSKDDLLAAAFEHHMSSFTESAQAAGSCGRTAADRLARFIERSLRPPIVSPHAVSLWAGFLSLVQSSPSMHETHVVTYRAFRDRLEGLIDAALSESGRTASPAELRSLAIAGNAVIDGLWLEGGALPELFDPDELARLGRRSIGAICGLDLDMEDRS